VRWATESNLILAFAPLGFSAPAIAQVLGAAVESIGIASEDERDSPSTATMLARGRLLVLQRVRHERPRA
jgi:hypothetical protein